MISILSLCCLTSTAMPQEPSAPASQVDAQTAFTVPLKFRGTRKWKVQLPAERWSTVGTGFDFSKTHGRVFKTALEGTRLQIDSDGDGATDVTVEGKTAFVTMRFGSSAYAVRLQNKQGWKFAPGGYLTGTIKGQKIRIIDQNNNGSFADVGQDALILGTGRAATFLSEVVNVSGELYTIRVDQANSSLICTPFDGPSGTLKLSCTTKGKVLSAILKSRDSKHSFDMARAANGLRVPVGAYSMVCGELGLGKSRVKMTTGRSKEIRIAKSQEQQACWGGPVRAEFAYQRKGGKVHLEPNKVWYYGSTGETYENWVPLGASPKFTIFDTDTGQEVAQAHFPGSC